MATPDIAGNTLLDENGKTEWVPLSLTLVEYPKGNKNNCLCENMGHIHQLLL